MQVIAGQALERCMQRSLQASLTLNTHSGWLTPDLAGIQCNKSYCTMVRDAIAQLNCPASRWQTVNMDSSIASNKLGTSLVFPTLGKYACVQYLKSLCLHNGGQSLLINDNNFIPSVYSLSIWLRTREIGITLYGCSELSCFVPSAYDGEYPIPNNYQKILKTHRLSGKAYKIWTPPLWL